MLQRSVSKLRARLAVGGYLHGSHEKESNTVRRFSIERAGKASLEFSPVPETQSADAASMTGGLWRPRSKMDAPAS